MINIENYNFDILRTKINNQNLIKYSLHTKLVFNQIMLHQITLIFPNYTFNRISLSHFVLLDTICIYVNLPAKFGPCKVRNEAK